MTFEKFMKILKKNNVQFTVIGDNIYIDGDLVVTDGTAYITPEKGFSGFHTVGGISKVLKDVTEDDLESMIAYYRKFHRYDPLAIVDRIQLFGTGLKYVAASGKTYSTAADVLKALKRDLKKGIENLKDHMD